MCTRVCVKNRSHHGSWLPILLFILAILSHAFVRFTRMEWQIWYFRAIICTATAAARDDHGSVNATDDTISRNPTSLDFRFERAVPYTVLISNLNIFSIGKLSCRCLFNRKCISFLLCSLGRHFRVVMVWYGRCTMWDATKHFSHVFPNTFQWCYWEMVDFSHTAKISVAQHTQNTKQMANGDALDAPFLLSSCLLAKLSEIQ